MARTAVGPTERVTVRRKPERGRYDRSTVAAILDEALTCHLGIVVDGQPIVIPTIHARVGDRVFVHGSTVSRTLRTLGGGMPACLTVTLVDGLVLARSAMHHSMNYRSVVVLGTATEVVDRDAKLAALQALTDHVAEGRWDEIRQPSDRELAATRVLALGLEESSAKVRTGPPVDDDADLDLPIWAGVVPVTGGFGSPQPDPLVPDDAALPASVRRLVDRRGPAR